MRVIVGVVVVGLLCVSLAGCGFTAPVVPPTGFVYTNIKAPIDIDAASTPMPMKSGSSGSMSILGLVALGDASIRSAANEGGISTVEHVDYEFSAEKSQLADGTESCDRGETDLTALLTLLAEKSPDLATVIEAWPELPEAVRKGILAMVGAVQ